MKFGEEFEAQVITQGEYENRSIEESLDLGWKVLKLLPRTELLRVTQEELEKHYD